MSRGRNISEPTDLLDHSTQQASSRSSWDCVSVGITSMRTIILEKIKPTACWNRQVSIKIPISLGANVSTWTGECSETTSIVTGDERLSQYCPEQAEWILGRIIPDDCHVMRGRNLLLYSVLLHLQPAAYRLTRLVRIERCFLDAMDNPRSVTIYSIIDKAPSSVKIIESIEWDPQEDHEEQKIEATSSSSNQAARNPGLKKRVFYHQRKKKDIEGFLKRRGIEFTKKMKKTDLITLLEADDIQHPDAAFEDDFLDEDLESTDVVMEDAI